MTQLASCVSRVHMAQTAHVRVPIVPTLDDVTSRHVLLIERAHYTMIHALT